MNRRQFLTGAVPALAGMLVVGLPEPEPAPEWSEADVMAWLLENGYTTKENKEPYQRMNKSMYRVTEDGTSMRITYTWDREPGLVWERDPLSGKKIGWTFITEPTVRGYQLKVTTISKRGEVIGS